METSIGSDSRLLDPSAVPGLDRIVVGFKRFISPDTHVLESILQFERQCIVNTCSFNLQR